VNRVSIALRPEIAGTRRALLDRAAMAAGVSGSGPTVFGVFADRSVAEVCLTVGLRSVGSFTTSFGRTFGLSPTAYRAAHPPAAARARIPTCVLLAYARPNSSSFREDRSPVHG